MDMFSAIFSAPMLSHLSAYGHVLRLHKRPNIVFAILNFFILCISETIKAFGGILG